MLRLHSSIAAATAILAILGSQGRARADSKSYSTSYVTFQIPESWDCALEETEFVCHETGREKGIAMLAILAAKFSDPVRDNPAVYISELGHSRQLRDLSGKTISSRVVATGTRCIDGHVWYWGKQFESEVPNYFTEYFAGIQRGIAMLVTVSYERTYEAEGRPIARTIASTLRPLPVSESSQPEGPDESCAVEN